MVNVVLQLNGANHALAIAPNEMLIDTIRTRFGLTGTKLGCDQGSCGACTVRVGSEPMASCSTFTWQTDRVEVTTIEGLGRDDLAAEQAAFAETGAFQCGYCTPGLILSTASLLDTNPHPDRRTIIEWLGSNICRCTGYAVIVEAVEDAAQRRSDEPS